MSTLIAVVASGAAMMKTISSTSTTAYERGDVDGVVPGEGEAPDGGPAGEWG